MRGQSEQGGEVREMGLEVDDKCPIGHCKDIGFCSESNGRHGGGKAGK